MTFFEGGGISPNPSSKESTHFAGRLTSRSTFCVPPSKTLIFLDRKRKTGENTGTEEQKNAFTPRGVRLSAAARRRGDKARSHATRWLWAYGTTPLLFPRIRKDSLLPSFEIAFPTANHDIHVGTQQRTCCEVVQRRADCRKENGHQEPPPFSLSAVQIPSAINSTKRVSTMPTVT